MQQLSSWPASRLQETEKDKICLNGIGYNCGPGNTDKTIALDKDQVEADIDNRPCQGVCPV
jgi:hypothetical protein